MEEECAFWAFNTIVNDVLPPDYYSSTMAGSRVDQLVLNDLLKLKCEHIHKRLIESKIELPVITTSWFICLFLNILPLEVLYFKTFCYFLTLKITAKDFSQNMGCSVSRGS